MMMTRKTLRKLTLLIFMSALLIMPSCAKSPLTGWKYQTYEGGPPSWENDIGRPDGYDGEDPWR